MTQPNKEKDATLEFVYNQITMDLIQILWLPIIIGIHLNADGGSLKMLMRSIVNGDLRVISHYGMRCPPIITTKRDVLVGTSKKELFPGLNCS